MCRPAVAERSGCPEAVRLKHLAEELASCQQACTSSRVKCLLIKSTQHPSTELLPLLLISNKPGGISQSCSQFNTPQLLSAGTDCGGSCHPQKGLAIPQYVTDLLLFSGFGTKISSSHSRIQGHVFTRGTACHLLAGHGAVNTRKAGGNY